MKLKKELGIRTYKENGDVVEEVLGLKRAEFILLLLSRKIRSLRRTYTAMSKTTRVVPVWRYVGAWHEDETLVIEETPETDRDLEILAG